MSPLKPITLPNTDITTSRIGFGCNALLGVSNTRRQAHALLETAYDEGVRHFDVARSYEAGDSEDVLGEFARGKRDKITITSKFRVNQSGDYHGESETKAWLRRRLRSSTLLLQVKPLLQKLRGRGSAPAPVVSAAPYVPEPRKLESVKIDLARESLHRSLRELKTDYIDLFFIHEGEAIDCQPEVMAFLQQIQKEGKIRYYGIGSAFFRAKEICEKAPEFAPIIQFESSITEPHVADIARWGTRATITHGGMAALAALREQLKTDTALATDFAKIAALDVHNATALAGFLLQYALWENEKGIVLFRSSQTENIRANIRALTQTVYKPEQFSLIEKRITNQKTAPTK